MSRIVIALALAVTVVGGGTFGDDDHSVHEDDIESIAAAGITRGCNPPANDAYCPDDPVTRAQMAAFLTRALDLAPATGPSPFTDTAGSVFAADIDSLAAADITRGCNPPANDAYCPDDPVTRAQMAAFLTRALDLAPATGPTPFTDTAGSVFAADIDSLAAADITRGCNPPANDAYCPDDPVTRAQMAAFLTRALDLPPAATEPACPVFPADDIWNTPVDDLPVHARSGDFVDAIGRDATVHPDFGSGVWPPGSTSPIGIPYVLVDDSTPPTEIVFTAYGSESDPGPYPIPADAPIEGGPDGTGDRHVLVVDVDDCVLYELFDAHPRSDGTWEAASGAVFDLTTSDLRPEGWTSADAAGLPIFPGLVRYDEVASGSIEHAIRFTAPRTRNAHVWPARHDASSLEAPDLPPMGQRFRLRSDFEIDGFHPDVRVILRAMARYGIVLADNGSPWFLSGAPDPRWDNDVLRQLKSIPGSAFEAVDVSDLRVDPDSGRTAP